ncbi:MAG: glycoside hydrolase family 20 zincin-like fold domain-containing protein [Spirochaetota bacterium]
MNTKYIGLLALSLVSAAFSAAFSAIPSAVFWPAPREISSKSDLIILGLPKVSAPAALARPAALLSRELEKAYAGAVPQKNATTITLKLSSRLTRSEEYAIDASGRSVIIEANDEQGVFWGVHSLMQLLKWEGVKVSAEGYAYPGAAVHDWPETSIRSFMIQAPFGGTAEELKKNLDLLARMKIRYFALEFGPRVILDIDPTMAKVRPANLHFSKQQAKEIIEYGRSLGLEPIGYLNLLGHLESGYQKAPFTANCGIMIQDPEVYDKFVFPIVNEMLDVYGPVKYFHCGMDEAMALFKYFSEQKMDTVDLLVRHISTMNRFFAEKKIKMIIWHDMFLSPDMTNVIGTNLGPANGGAPYNTVGALAKLPKDVIIDYWRYQKEFETFPAIDYFKEQGFSVWASPWYYPFRLVRFCARKGVPTMGTIWAGVPKCFAFSPSDAATALYAQAAWSPGALTTNADAEENSAPDAVIVTKRMLYDRQRIGIDPCRLIVLRGNASALSINYPKDAPMVPEQHSGIPLDFSVPVCYEPLVTGGTPLEKDSKPAAILINGNDKVVLDGCNVFRDAYKMVLYMFPMASTKANVWGVEAVVSSNGVVLSVAGRDTGRNEDSMVPDGGFVLSAHGGVGSKMYDKLMSMRNGDRIAVLDASDNWIGGARSFVLSIRSANGNTFPVDFVDSKRNVSNAVLYQYGFGTLTGTKDDGIEVAVSNGVVLRVNKGKGNTAIPTDGFVLSMQNESAAAKSMAAALSAGDMIELSAAVGDSQKNISDMITDRRWKVTVDSTVKRLWFAATSGLRMTPGTIVGTLVIRYADASIERIVTRTSIEMVSKTGQDSPLSITNSNSWLVQRDAEPKQCLIYEWTNPKPAIKVKAIEFLPALSVLQSGLEIYGATCEIYEGK